MRVATQGQLPAQAQVVPLSRQGREEGARPAQAHCAGLRASSPRAGRLRCTRLWRLRVEVEVDESHGALDLQRAGGGEGAGGAGIHDEDVQEESMKWPPKWLGALHEVQGWARPVQREQAARRVQWAAVPRAPDLPLVSAQFSRKHAPTHCLPAPNKVLRTRTLLSGEKKGRRSCSGTTRLVNTASFSYVSSASPKPCTQRAPREGGVGGR